MKDINALCSRCGKENPEGARFCMECGADLNGYKVEISPKIEVAPKISVSAKAEGGVALKWKMKPIGYAEIRGKGKLPVFEKFIHGSGDAASASIYNPERFFCPQCGNYGSLETSKKCENRLYYGPMDHDMFGYEILKEGDKWAWKAYYMFNCLSCGKLSLLGTYYNFSIRLIKYVYLEGVGKIPVYGLCRGEEYDIPLIPTCPECGADCERGVSHLNPETASKCRELDRNKRPFDIFSQLDRSRVYVCPICGFRFLMKDSGDYLYEVPLCKICESRKAEYTCSSCGKQICENCVIKKGLLSKKYLCPNCK